LVFGRIQHHQRYHMIRSFFWPSEKNCSKTYKIMMHNFKKRPKKPMHQSNNIANVPHLNVSPLTTKATRLKGENMVHQWNNNTMCTQSHAYPLWRSTSSKGSNQHKPTTSYEIRCEIFSTFWKPFQTTCNL
jgi:hypothetical protein